MLVVSSFVFKVFYNGHFSLLDRDVSSNSLDSLQNPYYFLVARTSSPASPLPTTPPATSASMGRPAHWLRIVGQTPPGSHAGACRALQ